MPGTVDSAHFTRSVVSVPPLARDASLAFDAGQNKRVIDHLRKGGVRTLLYGGNANFYNIGLYEYAGILDGLSELAGDDMTVVPSAGPEYGRLVDQAVILKERDFQTVMVLPAAAMSTPDGARRAIQEFAERIARPVVVYIKSETYLRPRDVAALVDAGVVAWIKYAVVREDPAEDPLLQELVDCVDRNIIVSGIGEPPALPHIRRFGLAGFTSGSVCIAPSLSMQMLAAVRAQDWKAAEAVRSRFLAIEGLRNVHGPIPVLHEAVTLAGIADCGPILPLLANLDEKYRSEVEKEARDLQSQNAALAAAA